jgi:hypothetical protein
MEVSGQFPRSGRFTPGEIALSKVKGKVVPVLNLIKHYAMKAYEGVDV